MKAYISGIGISHLQKTCEQKGFPEELVEYTDNFLQIIPPDYKLYIDLMARRRMGRIIKAGVSAAKICLNDAGATMPEAIITGTGLGCIEDTERFLSSVLENQERLLNPAHFMQSTYNTLCSQIAIQLSCTNYNNTFVHRAFSFESALIDAMMLIAEERAGNVLVGGVDEITANHYAISGKLGIWKKEPVSSLHLLESSTEGTIPGEGAAYFFLTAQPVDTSYACLADVATFYKPKTSAQMAQNIQEFLDKNGMTSKDIDLLMLGFNGDVDSDEVYNRICNQIFDKKPTAAYKHLCGEFFTSTTFALSMASAILKLQQVPEYMLIKNSPELPVRNILVWNHYHNAEHSLLLVQRIEK